MGATNRVAPFSLGARRTSKGRDSLHPRLCVRHRTLTVTSRRPFECIDLTTTLASVVREAGLRSGFLVVQTRHTTTGLLVNEHEPLLLDDIEAMFERLAPAAAAYGHDDFTRRTVNLVPGERRNGHAHCRAAFLRSSEWIAVVNAELGLGRWQRVFLVECDGARTRHAIVTLVGEFTRDARASVDSPHGGAQRR